MKTGVFSIKKNNNNTGNLFYIGNIINFLGLTFGKGKGIYLNIEDVTTKSLKTVNNITFLGRNKHIKEIENFEIRRKIDSYIFSCEKINNDEYNYFMKYVYFKSFLEKQKLYVYYKIHCNEEIFLYGELKEKNFKGIRLHKYCYPDIFETNLGLIDEIGLKEEGIEIINIINCNYLIKSGINKIILEDIFKKAKNAVQ